MLWQDNLAKLPHVLPQSPGGEGMAQSPTTWGPAGYVADVRVSHVLDDLVAEQAALDAVVADLAPEQWLLPTPSPRWSIADQIGHLTYFDRTARLATADPAAFAEHKAGAFQRYADPLDGDALTLGEFRQLSPSEQLAAWRDARAALAEAAAGLADDARVDWYGPSMGAKSFLTARLMEVWAHGQDIVDTLAGATGASGARLRPDTDRLRHIAQLGVITRGWSYAVRGETPPDTPVRVTLEAPSGATWEWETPDDVAADSISGPAGDFCRVVTQRRHVDDTGLVVTGSAARSWMQKAQAFAGAPSDGPRPRRVA
jgi:uncharacterized protein (TIGR03084 family)